MMPPEPLPVTPIRAPGARSNWRITVDLDGLTWGDIRAMAELIGGMPDDERVEFETYTDADDNAYLTGIRLPGWVL